MKILWIALFLTGAASVTVMLNHPTSLPCGCAEKVIWRKISPRQATVAECLKEKCIAKGNFKERFAVMHEKNYSLFLKSVKYNDRGTYQCICDVVVEPVSLDVVVPITVTANELGNATLPCYADTQSGVRDVTWLHDEQNTLHYTVNEATKPGDSYKGRVSLTEDGFRDGDVSLTITDLQKRDAGLYRCFVHDETDKGYPHAYMLLVNEKFPGAGGDQTESSDGDKRTRFGLIISFSLFICFLLILRCRKKMSSPRQETHSEPVQESDLKLSTRPF